MSPSSRRAWIEISHWRKLPPSRAWIEISYVKMTLRWFAASPSSRRAWIEILRPCPTTGSGLVALLAEGVDRNKEVTHFEPDPWQSPSSRRAWIEIDRPALRRRFRLSPSSRRAWIEISPRPGCPSGSRVALLAEGVDRNTLPETLYIDKDGSPSSRRAWIEIPFFAAAAGLEKRRPPRGGRG